MLEAGVRQVQVARRLGVSQNVIICLPNATSMKCYSQLFCLSFKITTLCFWMKHDNADLLDLHARSPELLPNEHVWDISTSVYDREFFDHEHSKLWAQPCRRSGEGYPSYRLPDSSGVCTIVVWPASVPQVDIRDTDSYICEVLLVTPVIFHTHFFLCI